MSTKTTICIVLVIAMLAVTIYAGFDIIKSGNFWFREFKTSYLIHHGAVPVGYQECEEHYEDGFMDYTDFCKYYYTEEEDDIFAADDRYTVIQKKDIEIVTGYCHNCSSRMANQDRETDFDFDYHCISAGDYVYVNTKEGERRNETQDKVLLYEKYDNYSVYLYDRESHTLYYVHNNG